MIKDISVKLYRGFNKLIESKHLDNPFLVTPRTPIHTNYEVHCLADRWFEMNLGIKARSECIFCTPDIHTALRFSEGYEHGCVAEITPEGNYQIVFSENVIDFNEYPEILEEDPSKVQDWLSNQDYLSVKDVKDIPEGFMGEIMLYCASFGVKVIHSY
ncbi:hypothetical protein D0907_11925 [Pseudoalteromonas lipolytica]|uniref:Uncharacterized protein n=1 Tax=Pseudoalteromonas lipolytica TaxID=570156 RepID=A0AAD0S0R0_9GAMM|nr:hypothetical protein D0907_11925 [Pseudoalteromonas donghaensis]